MTPTKAPEDALVENALDNLKFGMDFAYENGLHEFGYDPVETVRDAITTLLERERTMIERANRLFDIYVRRLMHEDKVIDLERADKDRALFADALTREGN